MYQLVVNKSEVYKCILCYEPFCRRKCEKMDPSRILRALRFDNTAGAILMLPEEDCCSTCEGPCMEGCTENVPVKKIMSDLREDGKHMEEAGPANEVDLSCDICGVPLENPFLLSSSVVASNYEMCARAFEQGWAGAAFKTVSLMEIHEASPRFSALKGSDGSLYGFKNIEQLSDHSLEENLKVFARLKKDYPNKVIIASIMGRNEEEWTYLADAVTKAGADVVECNFSCPNMEEKGVGVDVGQDPDAVRRYTAAVRRGTHLPILAKMTPNLSDMRPPAWAALDGGANGIAAINTIKSVVNMNLDTLTSSPSVRGLSSEGGYSGAAVKPIALRFIADLGKDKIIGNSHISGMGGIETWRDALEFILLGAGSLQVTTAVMQYGYRIIDDLLLGLKIYMSQRGYHHVRELIGIGLENLVDTEELERDTIIYPHFRRERCIGCGRCYISCMDGGHQALKFDTRMRRPNLNAKRCVGCHLCVLVCPKNAITGDSRRIYPKW